MPNKKCVENKIREEFDSPLFVFSKKRLIEEATDGILDIFQDCNEKPIPVPKPPVKKIKGFKITSGHVKLLNGWDNGVTTVRSDQTVAMFSGDGFEGNTKHGTGIHILKPGDNPMDPKKYVFWKGTRGKSYGALYFKDQLLSLQSDKGSGYEGAMDCRIWNVTTGRRSGRTLQSLHGRGVNWFFVQKGHGYQNSYQADTVDIGCVSHDPNYAAHNKNFKSPIRMWRGNPNDIGSFKSISVLKNVDGKRNDWMTTCSVTYLKKYRRYIVAGGDWTTSEVQYWLSQVDNVLGPYTFIGSKRFKPPMVRKSKNGQWSGAFTSSFFERNGQWYLMVSGHRADLAKEDDCVFIYKIEWI